MDNSLFLMQRYLGSDDDDESSDIEYFEHKPKKIKLHNSNSTEQKAECSYDALNSNEDFSIHCKGNENLKSAPKKKKKSTKTECDNDILNNGINDTKPTEDKEKLKFSTISPSKKRKKSLKSEIKTGCNDDILSNDLDDSKSMEDNEKLESKKVSPSKKKKKSIKPEIKTEYNNMDHTNNNICNENLKLPISASKKKKKSLNAESIEVDKTATNSSDFVESDFLDKKDNQEEHFRIIGQIKTKCNEKVKPVLPKWLSNPMIIGIDLQEQEIPLSDLSYLDDTSKNNLHKVGIHFLFPVQLSVIPWLMQSNENCLSSRPSDLCVSAPTGSGKTLAFVLPIVQSLKNRIVSAIRALVVLPVSELAFQVHKVFQTFVQGTDLKVSLLTGKKSFISEQDSVVKSGIRGTINLVDIVVTTPGRILDHINRTDGFCLQQLRYLVIDEADRMMDWIQQGWLKRIEDAVYSDSHKSSCVCFASGGKRIPFIPSTACSLGYIDQPLQKLLYSATLSHDPEKLHTLSLYKPKLFTAQIESNDWIGKCPIPKDLTAQAVICKNSTKPMVLCHLIKEMQFKKVLCFTESIERAQRLHIIIAEMGLVEVRGISSSYRPVQRKIILEQFTAGKVNLLVCSDLVARGIDIENIDCVVSYDVPIYVKTYIHRIGRTARAGKKGRSVTLLTEDEVPKFKRMLESADITMPEKVIVNDKDLEPYVNSFKNALTVADSKLKKMKSGKIHCNRKNKKAPGKGDTIENTTAVG